MEIRPLEPERDAAGVVELLRETSPLIVVSPASWAHRIRTIPGRAQQAGWVAEDDGQVVANGWAFRTFFSAGSTSAMCGLTVTASHRRRGIGSRLMELIDAHVDALGSTTTIVGFEENEAGVAFAAAHGFREERAEENSAADLRTIDEQPFAAIDIRSVAQIDPRLAYEVDVTATRDMPSTEVIDEIPYDEWVEHVLDYPLFSAKGSFVAFVDGAPAAVSLLIADEASGRSMNMFTGTLSQYRGRGLGLAVKLASIAWAKERGITQMATRNDETNAPMLAINRRLGFESAGRRVEWIREGTVSSRAPQAPAT